MREKNLKWNDSLCFQCTESCCCSCQVPRVSVMCVSLQASFPGNLHLVMVLRPTGFFQRTFTDIGFRFSQEDFLLKLPVQTWLCRAAGCSQGLPLCFSSG